MQKVSAAIKPSVIQIILPDGSHRSLSVTELGIHIFSAFAVNSDEDPYETAEEITQEGFDNLGTSFIESFEDHGTHQLH